jgi:hypothetical protein
MALSWNQICLSDYVVGRLISTGIKELDSEINKSIKNESWLIKKSGVNEKTRGLNHSQIKLTQDCVTQDKWDAANINRRSQWIAESMVKISSVDNVLNSSVHIQPYL